MVEITEINESDGHVEQVAAPPQTSASTSVSADEDDDWQELMGKDLMMKVCMFNVVMTARKFDVSF